MSYDPDMRLVLDTNIVISDEMVLETAINGFAEGLVSFNRRHFEGMAKRFGIPVLSPQQALRRISD